METKVGVKIVKYSKYDNSGVTLVELIIAMALVSIIITLSFSVINFGNKVLDMSVDEFDFQFSTRMVLDSTSKIVRYSTALFTIPRSSFRPDNLSSGWDYIGIREVTLTPAQGGNPAVLGNEIVKYQYDNVTDTHLSSVILPAQDDTLYQFVFKKTNPQDEDSLLQFTIQSYPKGSVDPYGIPRAQLDITSEVEAQNALQVIDLGSNLDPAVAIAFRLQDRKKNVVGHVALVLDTSGSMSSNLSGGSNGSSRISILRDEAKTLINAFAQEDNIDISLVPFATSANNPGPFLNAKGETASLITTINGLTAIGGTNTGDGLRRAFKGLQGHNATLATGVNASNYVIVLVDGVTTFASVVSNANRAYVTGVMDVNEGFLDRSPKDNNGQIAGNGSSLDTKGTAYVNTIGDMLRTNNFAKVYVIGFSSISSELNSVNDIATACGAPSERVFRAGSADALTQVFESIRQDIVNDLWYLQGPDL